MLIAATFFYFSFFDSVLIAEFFFKMSQNQIGRMHPLLEKKGKLTESEKKALGQHFTNTYVGNMTHRVFVGLELTATAAKLKGDISLNEFLEKYSRMPKSTAKEWIKLSKSPKKLREILGTDDIAAGLKRGAKLLKEQADEYYDDIDQQIGLYQNKSLLRKMEVAEQKSEDKQAKARKLKEVQKKQEQDAEQQKIDAQHDVVADVINNYHAMCDLFELLGKDEISDSERKNLAETGVDSVNQLMEQMELLQTSLPLSSQNSKATSLVAV